MIEPIKFEIKKSAIFHGQNSQTAFVGIIESYEGLIKNGQVELLFDAQVDKIVEIWGEMIPAQKKFQGYRAVMTNASSDGTERILTKHECKFRRV